MTCPILRVTPSNVYFDKKDRNNYFYSIITIRNISKTSIAFKFKTNAYPRYKISPASAIIKSGSNLNISIRSKKVDISDKILIQYVQMNNDESIFSWDIITKHEICSSIIPIQRIPSIISSIQDINSSSISHQRETEKNSSSLFSSVDQSSSRISQQLSSHPSYPFFKSKGKLLQFLTHLATLTSLHPRFSGLLPVLIFSSFCLFWGIFRNRISINNTKLPVAIIISQIILNFLLSSRRLPLLLPRQFSTSLSKSIPFRSNGITVST